MGSQTLIHERNIALQDLHKRILHSSVNKNLLTTDIIVSIILEEKAPRFYITPHQAELLVRKYRNDGCRFPSNKIGPRREMIKDLNEEYEKLVARFPHTPKKTIFKMLVEQPAKSFYMRDYRVRDVILNYRRYAKKR